MEDLKSFQVQVDKALKVSLGDTQMHVPPPPAGGTLLAFILKIMKGIICFTGGNDSSSFKVRGLGGNLNHVLLFCRVLADFKLPGW